jgi:hypothetical protein
MPNLTKPQKRYLRMLAREGEMSDYYIYDYIGSVSAVPARNLTKMGLVEVYERCYEQGCDWPVAQRRLTAEGVRVAESLGFQIGLANSDAAGSDDANG